MKELEKLIKNINEFFEKDLLFLDYSYGGYRVEMWEGFGSIHLSKRGTKKETLIFLNGMLKLRIIRREIK